MANNIFNKMKQAAGDIGTNIMGAITFSEYEQNMTPTNQEAYENALSDAFTEYYNSYLFTSSGQPLSFDMWIATIDTENLEKEAVQYEERKDSPSFMQSGNQTKLATADKLQKLSHLHTGRIEDLISIVRSLDIEQPAAPAPGMPGPEGPVPGASPDPNAQPPGFSQYSMTPEYQNKLLLLESYYLAPPMQDNDPVGQY